MKKIFYVVCILLLIFYTNVKAITVSEDTVTVEKGSSVDVNIYGNYEEATSSDSFTIKYTTYDIIPSFNVNSELTLDYNNQVYNINFNENKTGEVLLGTLNIKANSGATATIGRININGTIINVNIIDSTDTDNNKSSTKTTNVDKNLLKAIKSNFVSIDLKDNVFEYDVTIDDDLEKLDLKPIAYSSSAVIDVSTQVIKDLEDNQIIINVEASGVEAEYTINVKQVKKEKKTLSYDKETYTGNDKLGIGIIIGATFLMLCGIIIATKRR